LKYSQNDYTQYQMYITDIVDIILVLGEYRCDYQQAVKLYRDRFPDRQHPNDRTIALDLCCVNNNVQLKK